jgi:hypothetical protein
VDYYLEWCLALLAAPTMPSTETTGQRGPACDLMTDLDLDVIRSVYEVIAEQFQCAACSADLRTTVHVRLGAVGSGGGAVVTVRCRGWRRHRHSAQVVDESGHLVLRPLVARPPSAHAATGAVHQGPR